MIPVQSSAWPLGRLGPADLVHFWAEDAETPLQIGLLVVLDGAPGEGLDAVRRLVGQRAAAIPKLRAIVRWGPFGGARWIPDEGFDVARHVVPGDAAGGLLAWAADRAVAALPRDRPLWRLEVVSGLPEGRCAVLLVLHHAIADGLAALAIARRLLDDEAPIPAPGAPRVASAWPQRVGAVVRAVPGLLRRARTLWRELSILAPHTRLARPLGATRRLAVAEVPLEKVRDIGHGLGATVNDVVLAAVAAGLRERLRAWGDDPEHLTLRASMPMAVAGRGTNEVDITVLPVPLAGEDPVARLRAIAEVTRGRKEARRAGRTASVAPPWVPPFLGRWFVRWLRRAGGRRVNLYVTNVPGPTDTLRFGGATVLSVVPLPPLVAGVPLGVAAVSYAGTLVIALHADGSLRDLDEMAAGVGEGLDALATRSG